MSKLDAFFKFKENNTDVKTEIIAGITIFLAMAYILIVNPAMLSETGMDIQGVFIATALSAAIATINGIHSKLPICTGCRNGS